MIRITLAAALAAVAIPAVASAADYRAPAVQSVNAIDWTGGYLGLIGGVGWAMQTDFGGSGGFNAGYNVAYGANMVVGVDGDFVATNNNQQVGAKRLIDHPVVRHQPRPHPLRQRQCHALRGGRGVMPSAAMRATTGAGRISDTQTGWTIGFGVEATTRNNVTARAEYRYTNLGAATLGAQSVSYQRNDLLIGVDLRLFCSCPAPAASFANGAATGCMAGADTSRPPRLAEAGVGKVVCRRIGYQTLTMRAVLQLQVEHT